MEWHQHYDLREKHAFLSPSSYHWTNYTPEKLREVWLNNKKKEEGTMIHAYASVAIKQGYRQANLKRALNKFINDAIGFRMESELVLHYSDNCFGTADAIQYYADEKLLRIHDLKTGNTKASFRQLYIYAALFCLEYNMNPTKFETVLRIYQGSDYFEELADPAEIQHIAQVIVESDAILDGLINTTI